MEGCYLELRGHSLERKSFQVWVLLPAVFGLFLVMLGLMVRSRHAAGVSEWALESDKVRAGLLAAPSSRHPASVLDLTSANARSGFTPEIGNLQVTGLPPAPEISRGNRVFLFLRSDCPCSLEFAGYFALAWQCCKDKASFVGVFEPQATTESLAAFRKNTNAPFPFVVDQAGTLAKSLGVTKAGAFALVRPNGSLDGLWNGCSGPGLQDLLGRVGLTFDNNNTPSGWGSIPGAAVAGCPLISY